MKTPEKRTSTLLIAIVLPLAFMAYWLVRMFNVSLGPEAIGGTVFIAGVLVAVGLGVVALRKGAKAQWVAVSFVVGAVLCVMIFLGISLSLAWHESVPPFVSYHVSVTGLEGLTGDGVTTVIVPVPMKDGEIVIPSSELADRTFDNWTTTMVGTKDGTMLAFQHRQKNLTDIDARFYLYEKDISGTERLPEEYLSPVLERIPDEEYTTVVYVDEGIRSDRDLAVTLELNAGGGLVHGMAVDKYRTMVREHVPAGTAGRIVVTAKVEEVRPSGP